MSSNKFVVNIKSSGNIQVLNVCDKEVLGEVLKDGPLEVYIDPRYFNGRETDSEEVINLLKKHSIINLVGNASVSLAIRSGFGNRLAVRKIQGVDFLIIYKFVDNIKSSGNIQVLNVCDKEVLGEVLKDGPLEVYIDPRYFNGRETDSEEVINLLKKHSIINLVGNASVSLAIRSGFGNRLAVRKIQGVDFLIIYKFVDKYQKYENGQGDGHC